MTRVVISGSRSFKDYELFARALALVLEDLKDEVELVSGHAEGADRFAERFAEERGLPIKVMEPDWKTYGRAAGLVRNRQMLEYAAEETPYVIAFWEGASRGTKNTVKTAQKLGIPGEICMI